MLYKLGRLIVFIVFKLLYRFKVTGHENLDRIPENQGVLLCSNHISNFDPPLVGVATTRTLSFMAKSELFEVPVLGALIKRLNAFPVKRGSSDRQALKTAIEILNNGKTLIMFPEGHRSKNGQLKEGLAGVGFLALRTEAAIVPVAIKGGYHLFRPTQVIFGQPIDFTELKANKGKPQEATAIIMSHIGQLLEEKSVS
ncbi:lysophospholipid acyltransferase family protein [Pullulanibacillus sp. KACC 23026]|uniref:lysophospholipid acyltransferase family protein n=1 Tax=Pullulanibacillus sp. KACC 23026 TaxID=3028315 RepID=UPI0023AF67A7|nr:lysophospholipid acyltransferase family protein [Pullulanibacillus sp. KACC 23026]WEG14978.1 lysophospholipid acyltransferase family protein [Pullulanibacillus sp. KACC 23026]